MNMRRSKPNPVLAVTASVCVFFACLCSQVQASSPITDPVAALDDGILLFEDRRFLNAEEALMQLSLSPTFRRLDSAQKSLAYSHIAYSKMNRGKDLDSIRYIDDALVQAKREFGERSLAYLERMETKMVALYWGKKRSEAARVGREMETILERMGRDEYADEIARLQSVMGKLQRVNLKEANLPIDLSDFYTDCETIQPASTLLQANAIMNDYLVVGEGYKPNYKQSEYFRNTYLVKAKESSSDRRNRIIFILDDEHLQDWCVVYRDGKKVDRAVIAAKHSR